MEDRLPTIITSDVSSHTSDLSVEVAELLKGMVRLSPVGCPTSSMVAQVTKGKKVEDSRSLKG